MQLPKTQFTKDPDERLDYRRDLAQWLSAVGDDTIVSAEWIPVDFTWGEDDALDQDGTVNDTTSATIWLTGGVLNSSYKVTSRVTTADGRITDRTYLIQIRAR